MEEVAEGVMHEVRQVFMQVDMQNKKKFRQVVSETGSHTKLDRKIYTKNNIEGHRNS